MTRTTTPLRWRMLDDMKLRNMAKGTRRTYVRSVADFSAFHGRSPDELTLEDVRDYQLHLVARGLKASSICPIMSALRFFYGVTLGNREAAAEIPLPRKAEPLPAILSREEVARLLTAVDDLAQAHRAEDALDHDQVLAVLDAVEVEELELLVEAARQLVLPLPFGKVLELAHPAAGVGDRLPLPVVDRDADPTGHAALLAVAKAEGLDELRRDAALRQVRVPRIEREREAERLVAPRFPSLARNTRSTACRSRKSRSRRRGAGWCRLALIRRSTAFLAALASFATVAIGTPSPLPIPASTRPAWRSVAVDPSRVSIRCTKSSALPATWQGKQWNGPLARFTERLGSPSSWKGHRIFAWSPFPTGVRPWWAGAARKSAHALIASKSTRRLSAMGPSPSEVAPDGSSD